MKRVLKYILIPTQIIYTCLLLLWAATSGWAQQGEGPRIRAFTPTDYGARNQNWALAQDGNGKIHVANSSGLLTFDGARWQQHTLPGQKVLRSVAVTPDGRIYVGAYNEFGYFPQGGEEYISLTKELLPDDIGEEIWNIITLDSVIVFHSFGSIYVYDGQRIEKVLPPGVILNIVPTDDGLLVPVIDQGLFRWQPGGVFTLIAGTEALAGQRIKGVVAQKNALLIATELNGIYWLEEGRLRPWTIPLTATLANEQINRFQALRNGTIAVGTILNGLYLLEADGTLRHHMARATGLQNNTVISLLEDRAGDLWVGLDRGIDLVVLSDPLRYFTASQQAIGSVYAAALFQGQLYIGTNQGLFRRPVGTTLPYQLVAGTQGQVWELRVLDGQLLCGHNSGTFRIVGKQAIRISEITGGWQLMVLPEWTDHLLQATYTGLIRLDRADNGQWVFGQRFSGLAAPLRELVRTDTLEFLASHASQGLYRLTLDPILEAYTQSEELGEAQGLPGDHLFRLSDFPEGILVQNAEQNWLYHNSIFAPIDSFRGERLYAGARVLRGRGDTWMQVLPNTLWLFTKEQSYSLPLRLGQDHPEVIDLANGQYLFCLDEGYALLTDDLLAATDTFLPLSLAWYYNVKNYWQGLRRDASVLAASQNHLRFVYSQPVFDYPTRYRHRLLGFTSEWSEWSDRYEKEYTNLPAGNYQFELESERSGASQQLLFTILPPWYRSDWSYIMYCLLALLALLAMYRWHQWRLAWQARELDMKRDQQLQQERTQLRNEQLQADIIRKSKELANSTLTLVRKNEILLQLKQELNIARKKSLSDRDHYKLNQLIDKNMGSAQDWEIFESNFNEVHEDFFKKLKQSYPELTPGDMKLAAYLRMNLSSKDIAPLLYISLRGVENKRYRLRKKMDLDIDANLNDFFMNY